MRLNLNSCYFDLTSPMVMGVLNVTPDSFSDGGQHLAVDAAVDRAYEMIAEGAGIIDIGGESTRPGSEPTSADVELDRILPVLRALPKDRVILSVDTNKPEVQEEALRQGAHMINDILGGSETLFRLAERFQAALALMHTSALPAEMQNQTDYDDVVEDIHAWFSEKHRIAQGYSIPMIWADPGIGFGKTLNQNLQLMRNLHRFRFSGWRLLIGTSRKSWIGKLTGASVNERMGGSIASIVCCYQSGADTFRVHDVRESVQALKITRAIHPPSESSTL